MGAALWFQICGMCGKHTLLKLNSSDWQPKSNIQSYQPAALSADLPGCGRDFLCSTDDLITSPAAGFCMQRAGLSQSLPSASSSHMCRTQLPALQARCSSVPPLPTPPPPNSGVLSSLKGDSAHNQKHLNAGWAATNTCQVLHQSSSLAWLSYNPKQQAVTKQYKRRNNMHRHKAPANISHAMLRHIPPPRAQRLPGSTTISSTHAAAITAAVETHTTENPSVHLHGRGWCCCAAPAAAAAIREPAVAGPSALVCTAVLIAHIHATWQQLLLAA